MTTGDTIEPGFPSPFEMTVECGIEWLGELNTYRWRTDESMPSSWDGLVEDGTLRVEVSLMVGDDPVIDATAGGSTVTYRPTNETMPPC